MVDPIFKPVFEVRRRKPHKRTRAQIRAGKVGKKSYGAAHGGRGKKYGFKEHKTPKRRV